jgi:hypothetical protein
MRHCGLRLSSQYSNVKHEVVRVIDGNHSQICKFGAATDPGYKAVLGAPEDYIMALKEDLD